MTKWLRLSALTLVFTGFSTVVAQQEASGQAGESSDQAQALWSSFDADKSSLLPQAYAVIAALRRQAEPEGGVETVAVAAENLDDSDEGFCRHMGTPDSRIMSRRCINQTHDEREFEEFQYRAEFEQNRRMHQNGFIFQ